MGRVSAARRQRAKLDDVVTRLIVVKRMVAGTKDAMPTMAGELRREACETIDDIIQDLRRGAAG